MLTGLTSEWEKPKGLKKIKKGSVGAQNDKGVLKALKISCKIIDELEENYYSNHQLFGMH